MFSCVWLQMGYCFFFHQDFSDLMIRSIRYCLGQLSAGQKDTRESRIGGLAACLNQMIPAPALLSMEGCGE